MSPFLQLHVTETLIPSTDELKTAFYQSVVSWEQIDCAPGSSKNKNKRRRINVGSGSKREEGSGPTTKKTKMEDEEAVWRTYVMDQFQKINDKQGRIETLMMSVLDKLGI